jgi:DNA-binding response OmpR family regulator
MHAGKINLTSQPGKGTSITFSLPIGTPDPETIDTLSPKRWVNPYSDFEYRIRRRPFSASIPTFTPRYVLVEKGKSLFHLLSSYLPGCEIISTTTFEKAVVEIMRSPTQGVFVNYPPNVQIDTLVQELKTSRISPPIFHCWVPDETETAQQMGAVSYLVKPVDIQSLLSTISQLNREIHSVLIIDDQLEALQLFARYLSAAEKQYDVLQAKNGSRGLSMMRQYRPDLVLLDLMMPGIDGFHVLNEMQSDPNLKNIPVIVVSSQDPINQPITTSNLTVFHAHGLSARELST